MTARDRKGRRLLLPRLRATYDQATEAIPERPSLLLSGDENGAEATATLALARGSTAFAALLKGLLEVSRRHRDLELEVAPEPGDGATGAPAPEARIKIRRGAFDGAAPALEGLVERLSRLYGRGERRADASPIARHGPAEGAGDAGPRAGAERIGGLEELRALAGTRTPFALNLSGSVYVPDGPETARRITPPGRFQALAWDPAGTTLAVLGHADGAEPALWLSTRGSSVRAVEALGGTEPTGAAFSPDGASLAVTLGGGRLAVLPAGGSSAATIQVARGGRLLEPTWSPDGESVACLVEERSRARTLVLVTLVENRSGARLFAVDSPAEDELAISDPTFSPDGAWIWVRALWGAKGEPRRPRLVRVPASKGRAEPLPVPLLHVRPPGNPSCVRNGRLFVAGIGEDPDAPTAAAWIDPAALHPDGPPPAAVPAPGGARLALPGPHGSILFVRRTVKSTRIHRLDEDGRVRTIRLPFSAGLTLPA